MIRTELILVWFLSGALALNETSTERFSLRLVGGLSQCEGLLQVQTSTYDWTGVNALLPSLRFGNRLCAQLDCGSARSVEDKKQSKRDVVTMNPDDCNNASLIHCFGFETYRSAYSLQLNCSDSVRLVSGRSLCSGSLQVRDESLSRSWTWVCEGALDRVGAEVLCRELGCGPPLLQGELSPLGQTFHCEGHESALMDCPRDQTRTNPQTCSTLQLTCSEPVRLVGGASRCEGTVEAEFRGEWRRMLTVWDLKSAGAVCQDLDCGLAVFAKISRGLNSRDVWVVSSDCLKKKNSAVRDCLAAAQSGQDEGRKVVCSGLLHVPKVSVSEGAWPVSEGAGPVSEGVWPVVQVLMGARFQVQCSVEPQYPGGSFQLFSPTVNLTLSTVNHSAHFLFTDVSPAHRGSYTCVYLLHKFDYNFTSSSSIYIDPQGGTPMTMILILVLVLVFTAIVLMIYCMRRRRTAESPYRTHM